MIDLPPPDHHQTASAIVSCGVPRPQVRIVYDEQLQSDVVTIGGPGPSNEQQLRCIHAAVHPAYTVLIEDRAQNDAYSRLVSEAASVRARAEAEQWLRANGRFAGRPVYEPGKSELASFARAVEAHCGLAAGSALDASSADMLMLRYELFISLAAAGPHKLACLTHVVTLSGISEAGIGFGFVSEPAEGTE